MSDGAGFDTFPTPLDQNVRVTAQPCATPSSPYPLNDTRPLEERILDRVEAAREALRKEMAVECEAPNGSPSSINSPVLDQNELPTRERMSSVAMCAKPDLTPSQASQKNLGRSKRSALNITRNLVTLRPFRFFVIPGLICCAISLAFCLGQLSLRYMDAGVGSVSSLMVITLLMGLGVGGIVIGLSSDLISVNRRLLERIDARLQLLESVTKTNETERNASD